MVSKSLAEGRRHLGHEKVASLLTVWVSVVHEQKLVMNPGGAPD